MSTHSVPRPFKPPCIHSRKVKLHVKIAANRWCDEVCGGRGDVCAHVEEGEEDAREGLLDAEQDEEGGRLSATSRTLRLCHLGKDAQKTSNAKIVTFWNSFPYPIPLNVMYSLVTQRMAINRFSQLNSD